MGAWGEGVFDNDDAANWIAKMLVPINKVLRPKDDARASYHYNEARVAARMLALAHGTDILGGPSLTLAIKALLRMRNDLGWLSSWRDPIAYAKALDKDLGIIRTSMAKCDSGHEVEENLLDSPRVRPPTVGWPNRPQDGRDRVTPAERSRLPRKRRAKTSRPQRHRYGNRG